MRRVPGFIHNGSADLPLQPGTLHAQLPLTGGGPAKFGAKELRFDRAHLRLFTDPEQAVILPRGVCLTFRTSLSEYNDFDGIRLPVTGDILRVVARVREEHTGETMPVTLRYSDALRRLDHRLVAHVRSFSERIDSLPGRARYKRIDTYLRLERARDFIEHHFAEDPCTERLAEQAAISRAHFIRLFGAFYGVSPKQRVLELKVAEAKRLLRETGLSIWEVAEASGFGNRCAFQRMFRDRVGMTPGRFRTTRAPYPAQRPAHRSMDQESARC